MTQLRAPRTYPEAITRIAGVIGWEKVKQITGRAGRSVRYWSQTKCKKVSPIDQVLQIDASAIAQ